LWKKFCGYVGATVKALAVSPVRHKFTPQLERALLAVGGLERQQVGPIRSFDAGAFNRPSEVAQVALLKSQLFALSLSGVCAVSLTGEHRLDLPYPATLAQGSTLASWG
jgi:hypothetical protein